MVRGSQLSESEKMEILNKIDSEFPSRIAKSLNRNIATIKKFLKAQNL